MKRYTYWRGPDGKPQIRSERDGKGAPTELLAVLGREAKKNDKGTYSITLYPWLQIQVALKMVLAVVSPENEELNQVDTWGICKKAIDETCRANPSRPIDPSKFLERADTIAEAFFQREVKPYVLISSLSVSAFPKNPITINGCTIHGLSSRGFFPIPPSIQDQRGSTSRHAIETKYKWIKTSTTGRSPQEAAAKAMAAVSLLRAYWTFATTFGNWSMSFSSWSPRRLAVVHTGPFHTLHHIDRSLALGGVYWRDSNPQEDRDLFQPKNGWDALEKERKWMTRRMSRLPYREELQQLFARYISALDQADPDVTSLQMWIVLEHLTGTIGKYEETADRASWIFQDRSYRKQLLNCFRVQRNRYVHGAHTANQEDQTTYIIKEFTESHLIALLRNDFQVKSLAEYVQLISMPVDIDRLKAIQLHVRRALRVHKPRRVTKPK